MWWVIGAVAAYFLLTRSQVAAAPQPTIFGRIGGGAMGEGIPESSGAVSSGAAPLAGFAAAAKPLLGLFGGAGSAALGAGAGGGAIAGAEAGAADFAGEEATAGISAAAPAALSPAVAVALPFAAVGVFKTALSAFGITGQANSRVQAQQRTKVDAYNSCLRSHGVDPNNVQRTDPNGEIQAMCRAYLMAPVPEGGTTVTPEELAAGAAIVAAQEVAASNAANLGPEREN